MFTPSMRAMISLADYRKEREDDRREQARRPAQVTIHSVTPCVCGSLPAPPDMVPTGKALRCVVLVDSSVKATDGSEVRGPYLMAWEHMGGEWYYLLIEEGEECPRPNP